MTIDLTSYAGQTKEIRFLAALDDTFNSNIFIDDISLEATASLTVSVTEDSILDGSELNLNMFAMNKKIDDMQYRETILLDGNYKDLHELRETLNQEVRKLKDQLIIE